MLNVLIVDDDTASLRLTTESLIRIDPEIRTYTASNGQAALEFLKGSGPEPHPRPDLVLLDWNIPGIHGRDVLARMRRDEMISDIPVVVVSASEAKRDVDEAAEFGVKEYLFKDLDLMQFMQALRIIVDHIKRSREAF